MNTLESQDSGVTKKGSKEQGWIYYCFCILGIAMVVLIIVSESVNSISRAYLVSKVSSFIYARNDSQICVPRVIPANCSQTLASSPNDQNLPTQESSSWILINYMDRCAGCEALQKLNCESGLSKGFHQCISYRRSDIDEDFMARNKDILNNKRGAGYWLWKPYFIWRTLVNAKDGDIVFYSDVAFKFVEHIEPIMKLVEKEQILVFELPYDEFRYSKADALTLINVDDPKYTRTHQRMATMFVAKRTAKSLLFVSHWLHFGEDPRIITDQEDVLSTRRADFWDNRHDQTILSLLSKKYGLSAFPNPSSKEPLVGRRQDFGYNLTLVYLDRDRSKDGQIGAK